MEEDLELKNYADGTVDHYLSCARAFLGRLRVLSVTVFHRGESGVFRARGRRMTRTAHPIV
jgi:hypothetical protein